MSIKIEYDKILKDILYKETKKVDNINKEELHNIFQKIRDGDNEGIEELFAKYQKIIKNISFCIVKDINIADEVVQLFFLKIMQIDKNKLPSTNELSWIYTVTKNQTIDFLRKQHNDIDIDLIYNIKDESNLINKIIDKEKFNYMIQGLDEIDREIISLKVLSSFTFKEIGIILNMKTATVQWKYYKDINTLKVLLTNIAMFIITTIIYINSRLLNKIENSRELKESADDYIANDNYSKYFDAVDSAADYTGTSKTVFLNTPNVFLLISIILFIITIISFIFFIKRQQKRNKKTSK